ncbi:MAG: methyl-accepting chemotaxis protein [Nitrospirales bacterium]|nr:methyl-accepting chemotaxis protein [Nitrospirales bacterium]
MKVTVAKKMYGGLALMMAVILCIAISSFFIVRTVARGYDDLIGSELRQVELSMDAQVKLGDAIHSWKNFIVRRDEKYMQGFRKAVDDIKTDIREYEKRSDKERETEAAGKAYTSLDAYAKAIDKSFAENKGKKDSSALDAAVQGADTSVYAAIREMAEIAAGNAAAAKDSLSSRVSTLTLAQIVVALVVASLLFFLSAIVIRSILRSVHGIADAVGRVSQGDLSVELSVLSDDELGEMSRGVNDMMESLRRISLQIQGMTTTIASSSSELSATTTQLSDGAMEQSQQAEQAATAITEVSQTVMDVAQNASEASNASGEASRIAEEGRLKVEDTVNGMQRIAGTVRDAAVTITELGRSSQEIGNIVRTINDIADQTNLLALNAAIEAARAGEQGRGFAVVADEVRKLAERTGKATREIGEMIRKIQSETERSVESMDAGISEVEKGVAIVEEARGSMIRIVEASNRGTDMIQRIAAAAEEQSTATEQVSSSMESIVNVTRATESSAGQIREASQDLAKIATELKAAADWFRTS